MPFRFVLGALCFCMLALPGRLASQDTPASRRAAIEIIYPIMVKALESGRFSQARNICEQAAVWEPENPVHPYNLACIEARAGPNRTTYAFAALQRAVDLGFADLETIGQDSDLATLRGDPRFPKIKQQVADNAARPKVRSPHPADQEREKTERAELSRSPTAPPLVQPGLERPIDLEVLVDVPPPAPAAFASGAPVGLYMMTRPSPAARTVEKLVWYFAPDGSVYQSLEYGFAPADLASHRGLRGSSKLSGDVLEVVWMDQRKSKGTIERLPQGFRWDGGTFLPAQPLDAASALPGIYEGHEPLSSTRNRAPLARTLRLRDDATFYWQGVSLISRPGASEYLDAVSNGYDTAGRWRAKGYCLVLVDSEGRIFRRIAFSWSEAGRPGVIVFAGTLYSLK